MSPNDTTQSCRKSVAPFKSREAGWGVGRENLAQGIIDRGGLEQGKDLSLREQRPTTNDQRTSPQWAKINDLG
jgi:hypothetical protein